MKRLLLFLSFGALAWGLYAQVAKRNSGLEHRLAEALKAFPDADTDKNGTLTINEAMAYLETHPALKEKLFAKTGGSKSSSKPASYEPGATGTKVFVCAHSYMIYTADTLPLIAKAAGVSHLKAGQQMIGGSRVTQHWDLPDDKNQAKRSLRKGTVDVLTLAPHMVLPDDGINHFTKLGLEKNPNLRVYVQASWVPWDGKTSAFTNAMRDDITAEEIRQMRKLHHEGWLPKLEAQISALNAEVGKPVVHVLPVSEAVYTLREKVAEGKAPGVGKQSELFRDDHGHPSEILSLLVTYCHFAAIYQRDPQGLPVPPMIKDRPQAAELNQLLQKIAWDAVKAHPMSGVK